MRGTLIATLILAVRAVALALVGTAPASAEIGDHYLAFPWKFNQTAYVTQGYHQGTHQNGNYYALDFDVQGAGVLGEIRAATSGTVVRRVTNMPCDTQNGDYGNYVDIKTLTPNGQVRYYTRYAHLSSVSVTATQLGVYRGQKIGIEGDTGRTYKSDGSPCGLHLHFRLATLQDCSSSSCAVQPEPMSGGRNFASGQSWTSDNYPYKADFSGDGCADVLSINSGGTFYLTRGNCDGTLLGTSAIGSQWNVYYEAITAGDFDSDGCDDILSTKGNGDMFLTRGNCQGGWLQWPDGTWSKVIGYDWYAYNHIYGPADFSGDGCADVISTMSDGTIWLTRGDCQGGWLTWSPGVWSKVIGYQWNVYNRIVAPGDFTGDGCSDMLSTKSDGTIWLTRGNCASSWLTWPDGAWSKAIGSDWQVYNRILAPGDLTVDGCADVASTKSTGSLWLTQGSCDAAYWLLWSPGVWSKIISGSGWGGYTLIF